MYYISLYRFGIIIIIICILNILETYATLTKGFQSHPSNIPLDLATLSTITSCSGSVIIVLRRAPSGCSIQGLTDFTSPHNCSHSNLWQKHTNCLYIVLIFLQASTYIGLELVAILEQDLPYFPINTPNFFRAVPIIGWLRSGVWHFMVVTLDTMPSCGYFLTLFWYRV